MEDTKKDVKQVACGVPWCIAVTDGDQFCTVHAAKDRRMRMPPPITRELELRFAEAMRSMQA